MWGAIIGDLAGSIYEFEQFKNISSISIENLITKDSFFSDDTILTIAILDAILNNGNYEDYLKQYAKEYMDYNPTFKPYFKYPFSPSFIKWANNNIPGYSQGNGAMMRISPIGYLFDNEQTIIKEVEKATKTSHNSKEAIDSATIIALIIFYARKKCSKEFIIDKLKLQYKYTEFKQFNMTCSETINNCLHALFSSNSYEESIKKVISYGGDTDTNACIVGSMAEALFGLNEKLIEETSRKIPQSFVKKLKLGYSKINHHL